MLPAEVRKSEMCWRGSRRSNRGVRELPSDRAQYRQFTPVRAHHVHIHQADCRGEVRRWSSWLDLTAPVARNFGLVVAPGSGCGTELGVGSQGRRSIHCQCRPVRRDAVAWSGWRRR